MARILVADDNAAIRRILQICLADLGHEVSVAEDGVEALEQIEAREPELLLLDIDMPRLDGLGVCRTLRRDHRRRHIPVVLMTGRVEDDRINFARLYDVPLLEKPFTLERLEETVAQFLPAVCMVST